MNVAQYITKILKQNNINYIFGYQGGNITYIIDAVYQDDTINYVQTYNEQSAAFAANAYSQVSENFGVAVSSSGPGAINLINGIANAYFDSIPCLYITGNVNTKTMKQNSNIRQEGFQETDIVSMVKGITKYAKTITNPKDIIKELDKAINIMNCGRKGPVLLDIPHDVQRSEIEEITPLNNTIYGNTKIKQEQIDEIYYNLKNAKKPVILVGGGCRNKKSKEFLAKISDILKIPIVSSLCGKDAINNTRKCYKGMIGSYGFKYSNNYLNQADLVIILGSRIDERQRVVNKDLFLKNAKVIHIDIDNYELGHIIENSININSDTGEFLEKLYLKIHNEKFGYNYVLNETIDDSEYIFDKDTHNILQGVIGTPVNSSIICTDVGKNQMLSAQSITVGKDTKFLTSGGLGSMGYAIGASIGACYADKTKQVYCITGDGGLMMNLQELQVIKRDNLPVKIILINNKSLGLIEDYQEKIFNGRKPGTKDWYNVPDFEKIAKSFGIDYVKIGENINYKIPDKKQLFVEIEV